MKDSLLLLFLEQWSCEVWSTCLPNALNETMKHEKQVLVQVSSFWLAFEIVSESRTVVPPLVLTIFPIARERSGHK